MSLSPSDLGDNNKTEPSIFGNPQTSTNDETEDEAEAEAEEHKDAADESAPILGPETTLPAIRDAPFRFLSLPTEARKVVYEHCLVAQGSVYVVSTHKTSTAQKFDDLQLHASVGHFDYDRTQLVGDLVTTQITTAMLKVHPSVVAESQAVLYGENRFIFRGFYALARFLKVIGDGRKHVRDIEILEDESMDPGNASIVQFAMSFLMDAALGLRRLHFGMDLASPYVSDPEDRTGFLLVKTDRHKQMAKDLVPHICRLFRARHRATRETADTFLRNVFSVHPVSFEPDGGLPVLPFLTWTTERDFEIWGPNLGFHESQATAAEFRDEMLPLLKVEGGLKYPQHVQWTAKASQDA